MNLTTEEVMALKVLQKDMVAARALAEKLIEDHAHGVRLPPINKITCDVNRLRVVVFYPIHAADGVELAIDSETNDRDITNWLDGQGPRILFLQGAERVELYEVPEPAKTTQDKSPETLSDS